VMQIIHFVVSHIRGVCMPGRRRFLQTIHLGVSRGWSMCMTQSRRAMYIVRLRLSRRGMGMAGCRGAVRRTRLRVTGARGGTSGARRPGRMAAVAGRVPRTLGGGERSRMAHGQDAARGCQGKQETFHGKSLKVVVLS
jgi:hypothetical protein